MNPLKYIGRHDYTHTHGYAVRIAYKSTKITHHKFFSDNIYGSKNKALKQAIKYRNQLVQELGIEQYLKSEAHKRLPRSKHSKNASGIIGVHPCCQIRGNSELHYWAATFEKDNKRANTKFSVQLYGDKEAFKAACLLRFEYRATLKVYRGSKFPGRIPVPWEYID